MKAFIAALALLLAGPAPACGWREDANIASRFAEAGINGTFVLYDVGANTCTGHDRPRAETRYIPASTFKIPNSLIGLTVGAVASVDEIFPYDGQPRRFDMWERDMGLREAIQVSNVPVYQELARRIGPERMRAQVAQLEYGNARIGSRIDRFWLDGPLEISAVEQVRFLARLAQGALPFPAEVQARVRDILRIEQGKDYTLYAKTGWGDATQPEIGWWVGWVETGGKVYAFALNVDLLQPADAEKRIPLARSILRMLRVLPAASAS